MPIVDEDGDMLKAETVLVKQGSGNALGIVTTGGLAGLVLEFQSDKLGETQDPDNLGGMCVGRMIDESELIGTKGGYSVIPDIDLDLISSGSMGEETLIYLAEGAASRGMNKRFKELVKEKTSGLELFFRMCEERGIPVDVENFNCRLR